MAKFDKEKFMKEFQKMLNSLPKNYSKKPLDLASFSTKRPPFTLFPEKDTAALDTTLFKEVNPVPTTMPQPLGTASKDPFDLSQFITKRPHFTLNPSIFGEIVDTSPKRFEQATTHSSGETTTHDPLDLSKFVTKRPPFVIYIANTETTQTSAPIATIATEHPSVLQDVSIVSSATHDPLDLSQFVTKRPPFTLDPAFFKSFGNSEIPTTQSTTSISFEKVFQHQDLERHRYEVYSPEQDAHPNVVHIRLEPIVPKQTIITKMPPTALDHVAEEKEKVVIF